MRCDSPWRTSVMRQVEGGFGSVQFPGGPFLGTDRIKCRNCHIWDRAKRADVGASQAQLLVACDKGYHDSNRFTLGNSPRPGIKFRRQDAHVNVCISKGEPHDEPAKTLRLNL